MRKIFIRVLSTSLVLLVILTSGASPAKVASAPVNIEEIEVPEITKQTEEVIQLTSIHQEEPIPENIQEPKYKDFDVPNNNSFKSFMSYKAITSKSSDQYKYQQKAVTNELGIRCIDGRYMIALGSYYCTKIGTKIDIVLDTGVVLECILGDAKADAHTDQMGQQQLYDKSVVEFIVDTTEIEDLSKSMGDMSYSSNFSGSIKFIRIYE